MVETFVGLMIVLASGLASKQVLIDEQPSLKVTIHHLEAYREIIGLCTLLCGLLGIYHSLSTSLSNLYSPIYWLFWTVSNCIAICVGVNLTFILIKAQLPQSYATLLALSTVLKEKVERHPHLFCWLGLTLGSWRILYPWLGV